MDAPAPSRSTMESIKTHPRYQLRLHALLTIALGAILNIIALIAGVIDWRQDPVVNVIAFAILVYTLSFVYQMLDLLSFPDDGVLMKRFLDARVLFGMDFLGFLCFLALLITNGIIVDAMWGGGGQLYTYNSVPWMACCAIHGAVTVMMLWKFLEGKWKGLDEGKPVTSVLGVDRWGQGDRGDEDEEANLLADPEREGQDEG